MNTAKPFARSACAVANSLDIVGDKWSLLVVRDLLHGKRTYGELALSPERIPTNILADRLERLERTGIITRTPYQQRPVRHSYTLTAKGKALGEVLLAFVHWGKQHIPGTVTLNQGPAGGEVAAPMTNSRRRRTKRTLP
jgi:DNA-binding HxlR family transcriptional regulator